MKNVKRIISIFTILAMLAVMFSAVTLTTAAEDITYLGSVDLQNYISLTGKDDGSTELKFDRKDFIGNGSDPGYHIVDLTAEANLKSGSLVYSFPFALKNVRFATSFSNHSWIGTAEFFASADGKNWSALETVRTTAGFEWASGNSEVYDAVTFTQDQNVRYLKVTLNNGVYQAGLFAIDYTKYASNAYYFNTLDLTSGTVTSNVAGAKLAGSAAGWYTLQGAESDTVVNGEAVFAMPNGISDLYIETAEIAFAGWGTINAYVSVDGNTWDKIPGLFKIKASNDQYGADSNARLFVQEGSVSTSKGYKYLKLESVQGPYDTSYYPGIVSVKYNTAEQAGTIVPTLDSPVYQESYDVTLHPADASITKTPLEEGAALTDAYYIAGGGSQINGAQAFADAEGNWKPGILEFYEDDVITNFNIDAFSESVGATGSATVVEVSTDGMNWIPVNTSREYYSYGGNSDAWEWAGCKASHNFASFDPKSNIHYVRITMAVKSWFGFMPALNSIKYDCLKIEEENYTICNDHETTVGAENATTITPYVDGAVFRNYGGEINGFYAFYDENSVWQPGEIIFHSEHAVTDYCIDAFSGNASSFGMLKFSASSDGVNYIPLKPQKLTHTSIPNWADMAGNLFYGKIFASEDIHYLKVEFIEKGQWISFAPAVRNLHYNTIKTCENKGHDFAVTEDVSATCTTEGHKTSTCARCGEISTETIPVLGHSFTNYVDDNNATYDKDGTLTANCDRNCGATDQKTVVGSKLDKVNEAVADLDGDGNITATDLTEFRKALIGDKAVDLTGDGVADIRDLVRFKNFILSSVTGPTVNVEASEFEDSNVLD